jgi:hypothetical protein
VHARVHACVGVDESVGGRVHSEGGRVGAGHRAVRDERMRRPRFYNSKCNAWQGQGNLHWAAFHSIAIDPLGLMWQVTPQPPLAT